MAAQHRFFYGSPRLTREAQQCREAAAARLAELQAMNARAAEAVRLETELICANIRAANQRMVQEFRDRLPVHSHAWFDALSPADQFRVASPRAPNRRSEIQRDYDEERAHGWAGR